MNVELSEEQEFFRRTTRRFLETEAPISAVRQLYDSPDGFDRGWWREAAQLGWLAPFVPEALGGGSLSGGAAVDAVIVAEEMGRLVSPGPFAPATVVAAALAWAGSPPQQADLLPDLVAGRSVAAWALGEPGGRWEPSTLTSTVVVEGDHVVVTGTKAYVEAAAVADMFLVTTRTGEGLTQVIVPAGTAGVTVVPGRSVDMTRRFGRVVMVDVRLPSSALVGPVGGAGPTVERQRQLAVALQCAELVGVADRTLELTLAYGSDRYAFGRPIVSFQALKHRIADMTVWLEGSKAVSDALASAVDEQTADAPLLSHAAKAYVGEHCPDVVDDCVQITGGIGVTWEHDLHLYNRRALVDRAVHGTPEEHKQRVYALLAHS